MAATGNCVIIRAQPTVYTSDHIHQRIMRRSPVDHPLTSHATRSLRSHDLSETTSARNITDESCSDPSVMDTCNVHLSSATTASTLMDGLGTSKKPSSSRKRDSRNMTMVTGTREREEGGEENDEHDDSQSECSQLAEGQTAGTGESHEDEDEEHDLSDDSSVSSESTTASTNLQDERATEENDHEFEIALCWFRNNRVLLRRLEEAAPRGNLSMINLTRRGVGYNEALLLHEAIRLNPLLSVLKLSYNDLGDVGTTVIARAFIVDGTRHHEKLSVLDLGFNNMGDEGCEAVAHMAIAGNPNITAVYLSGNRIRQKGALAVARAISHGSGLALLHMAANDIGSKGLKAIAGAIAKHDATVMELVKRQQQQGHRISVAPPTLRELHVGNTGIDSAGFIAIPGMLLSNCSIRVLSLSNNNITDRDILILSQALTQNKTVPLEQLIFSFNEITDQGVECLMNAVWGSKHLKVIKLDNNKLQDRGAQLCAVVLTSIPLTILDIGFNRVTTVGIKALMKNVSESNSLDSLGLNGIPVDQNASKALAYALAYNTSLTRLNLDNCSMGYAAQRHIVAGVISNRRAKLRVLTGFPIAQIAMTLGIPRLPEVWSNVQVLGFVRLMWQQWNLKSGQGRMPDGDDVRGPAPPASVAAAAKIALSSLGSSPKDYFKAQNHDKPFTEGPPVDPAGAALLERSASGTLTIPTFSDGLSGTLREWMEEEHTPCVTEDARSAITVSPLEDPVRRNKNLKWLRTHFRSLSEVGRLPFNNADLWQLHQYYFSPPVPKDGNLKQDGSDENLASAVDVPSVHRNCPVHEGDGMSMSMGRSISYSSLNAALAVGGLHVDLNNHKRTHQENPEEQASKRAKSLRTRIGFYPRIMAKIQASGTRPMDRALSLLRQLKYTENVFFKDKNPYEDNGSRDTAHQDIEMILLDLL